MVWLKLKEDDKLDYRSISYEYDLNFQGKSFAIYTHDYNYPKYFWAKYIFWGINISILQERTLLWVQQRLGIFEFIAEVPKWYWPPQYL